MADDFLKYLQGNQAVEDPYSSNPFAEGAAPEMGPGGATPFADELPFRFTQFAINPSSTATSGQTGRMSVGRSPFTSGQTYKELTGLRSQLAGMKDVTAPGEAPTAPNWTPEDLSGSMPQVPPIPEPSGISTTDMSMEPEFTGTPKLDESLRYGLPTKTYELPSNIRLNGMNPIYAAQKFEQARGSLSASQLAQLGPMSQVQGYDLEKLLGIEKYGAYQTAISGKSPLDDENRIYRNLSIIPTDVDPGLGLKASLANLAGRDFTYDPERTMSFAEQYANRTNASVPGIEGIQYGGTGIDAGGGGHFEQQGFGDSQTQVWVPDAPTNMSEEDIAKMYGQRLGDTGLRFSPTGGEGTFGAFNQEEFRHNVASDLAHKPEGGSMMGNFMRDYGMGITLAAMAAMTGGAASGLFAAPAAGAGAAATTASGEVAAGGLAGGLGMGAGASATTVNTIATMIAKYGAATAAQMMGIPMNNPMMQIAMAAVQGGYGGSVATPTTPGSVEGVPMLGEGPVGGMSVLPEDYYNSLNAPVLGTDEFGGMSTLPENYYEGIVPYGVTNVPGYIPGGDINSSGVTSQVGRGIIGQMAGIGAGPDLSGSSGLDPASAYAYQQAMEQYNADLGRWQEGQNDFMSQQNAWNTEQSNYESAYNAYQKQQEEFAKKEAIQKAYEEKMSEYLQQSGKYKTKLGLQSKQAGLTSDIQSNIASNPFYDPEENYTGIQSLFV